MLNKEKKVQPTSKIGKAKFPYDYRSVPLTSVRGSATFTAKKPSKKLLEAVNKMAELAFKHCKR